MKAIFRTRWNSVPVGWLDFRGRAYTGGVIEACSKGVGIEKGKLGGKNTRAKEWGGLRSPVKDDGVDPPMV